MLTRPAVQIPLLALTLLAVLGVAGKLALSREARSPHKGEWQMPAEVPLAGWESRTEEAGRTGLRRYFFHYGSELIEVEILYVSDPESLELPKFCLPLDAGRHFVLGPRGRLIDRRGAEAVVAAPLEIRHRKGTGSYALWEDGGRSHLSAYIHPAGKSTVDARQYTRNRYTDELSARRLGGWLFGHNRLLDPRSILAHFSVPTNSARPTEVRTGLEKAWADSLGWWAGELSAN